MTLSVGGLYDALLAFEAPLRGATAYPVHKRLRFADGRRRDIYDWVADEIELRAADRVLDAGCGVGFGTIRLAERGAARATGITVSSREAERAAMAAAKSPCAGRIEFRCQSFDLLPREAFDLVVAIESLKHSADLALTLRSIGDALAPGGRAVIVEDVFDGDESKPSARRLMNDWLLPRLHSSADYTGSLSVSRIVDLTGAVRTGTRLGLRGKLMVLDGMLALTSAERATALRAFRGGLHLEQLYATGAMRYLAFVASKPAGPERHR